MHLQLKKFRKLAGYKTQRAMANALGISLRRYASWEREEAMMSLEQAYEVTELLGCTLDELCGRSVMRSFGDPGQDAINHYYNSMNSSGRSALVESARLMAGSPDVRIEKDSPKIIEVRAKMDA